MNEPTFTVEDLHACWEYHMVYFVEALNGDRDIAVLREDLRSLIGSKYDPRTIQKQEADNE